MPFGLTNAPAVFQALINDLLRDMLNKFVFIYLDDILIFSRNQEEHVTHIRSVLRILLDSSLYVKAEKCAFHETSVSFLGYIIAKDCLLMDPAKVSAVTSWPVPETRKQLQYFLGFANFYRRFIRGFSSIASPLSALPSSKTSFRWTDEAQGAFDTLKTHCYTALILQIPKSEPQFIVEVDASGVGVGAVLAQRSSVDQKIHLCAFFSCRVTRPHRGLQGRDETGLGGVAPLAKGSHGDIHCVD